MSYSLRARPTLSPAELAAVMAAADTLLKQRARENYVAEVAIDTPTWRFSGRWFAAGQFSSLRRPQI